MARTIIAPIVGFLVILVELIFGIEIGEDLVSRIIEVLVEAAALGTILYGIFKNHKKASG